MPESLLYLLINLGSIVVPLACSFEHRLRFMSAWRSITAAILLPALPFLLWDAAFTSWGVWGFNGRYLTGITVGTLPLEEILFFICIPYACLFSHAVLRHFVQQPVLKDWARPVTLMLLVLSVVAAMLFSDRMYTLWTAVPLAVFLSAHLALKRDYWPRLLLSYLVILIPFSVVNGLLTGTALPDPVVWYDDAQNLGVRIGSIPLEDVFYGLLLIGLNITVYEELRGRRPGIQPPQLTRAT